MISIELLDQMEVSKPVNCRKPNSITKCRACSWEFSLTMPRAMPTIKSSDAILKKWHGALHMLPNLNYRCHCRLLKDTSSEAFILSLCSMAWHGKWTPSVSRSVCEVSNAERGIILQNRSSSSGTSTFSNNQSVWGMIWPKPGHEEIWPAAWNISSILQWKGLDSGTWKGDVIKWWVEQSSHADEEWPLMRVGICDHSEIMTIGCGLGQMQP